MDEQSHEEGGRDGGMVRCDGGRRVEGKLTYVSIFRYLLPEIHTKQVSQQQVTQ